MAFSLLRKSGAYVSAIALLVSGLVYIEGGYSPADATVPAASETLKLKNTTDNYAALNGTTDYFMTQAPETNGPIPKSSNFTVEAWVYETTGTTGPRVVISQGNSIGETFEIQIGATASVPGSALREIIVRYGASELNARVLLPQNRWTHLAVTVEPGVVTSGDTRLRLYLDSVWMGELDSAVREDITGSLYVGRNYDGNFFNGRIDQVKIWNGIGVAINTSMHSWSTAGLTSPPRLIAHYDFNDKITNVAGSRINNQSNKFKYPLTVVGTPSSADIKVESPAGTYTFPRTYLTEVGGWVLPSTVNAFSEVLVVGGGAAGQIDGGGGGGGGAGMSGSISALTPESIIQPVVGQGGIAAMGITVGQSSALKFSSTTVIAGGGSIGVGWSGSRAGGVGGTATTASGFTATSGGVGGNGPALTSGDQSAGTGPTAGFTNVFGNFGGGGGGGISSTPASATLIAIAHQPGGTGGGGEGAGKQARTDYDGKYPCVGSAGLGASTGGNGNPNTGGGGGAGAAYGDACAGPTNTGYDGERTFGGNGGSGVVILKTATIATVPSLSGVAISAALSGTNVAATWTGVPLLASRVVQYRISGGPWIEIVADIASGTHTLPIQDKAGYVEYRLSYKSSSIWSEWLYSNPVLITNTEAGFCSLPMKLKYVIPFANTLVSYRFGGTGGTVKVRWESGNTGVANTTSGVLAGAFNIYKNPGTYLVEICGDFTSFQAFNGVSYLTELVSWGEAATKADSALIYLNASLSGAEILVKVPGTIPPNVTGASNMFSYAKQLNDPNISFWDTSKVTNMAQMFSVALAFNQDIGSWNTSSVTDMYQMFERATKFNQNVGKWDISKVVGNTATSGISGMFSSATDFNNGSSDEIKNWDTSRIKYFDRMFSSNYFNQPIGTWNMSAATSLLAMFQWSMRFNQDLSSWNVSNVTTLRSTFEYSRSFNRALPWDVSNVTDMALTFTGASTFNQDISAWNVGNVTTMSSIFDSATAFNKDLSAWNTVKVTNMNKAFYLANSYTFQPPMNITALTTALNMLDYSKISDVTYGAILRTWAAGSKNSIPLGAIRSTALCYFDHVALMTLVSAPRNWVIVDKSVRSATHCAPPEYVEVTAKSSSHTYGDPLPSIGFDVAFNLADWMNSVSCKAVLKSDASNVISTSAPSLPVSGLYETVCTGPTVTGTGQIVTYIKGNYEVKKRPITVSVENQIYTSTQTWSNIVNSEATTATPSANYKITSGKLVGTEAVRVNVTAASLTSGSPLTGKSGPYALTGAEGTGANNANYFFTFVSGTVTVTPKSIIVTGKNQTKIYGSPLTLNNATDWVCEGTTCSADLLGKVSLSSVGSPATASAGSYQIISTVDPTVAASGYDVVNTNGGSIKVLKKDLTVTPVAINIGSGSAIPNYTFAITGYANLEDEETSGITTPSCSSGYSPETPMGTTLEITCSGGSSTNYNFIYETRNIVVGSSTVVTNGTDSTATADRSGRVTVPFSFTISPFTQVCFATLVVTNAAQVETSESNETYRVQITSNNLRFSVPLYEGSFTYELLLDGNCSAGSVTGSLSVDPASAGFSSYVPTPRPTSIVPSDVPEDKAAEVQILGSSLKEVVEIQIGGKTIKPTRTSDGSITFLVPALPKGVYDIFLVMSDGSTLRWESKFTVGNPGVVKVKSKTFASFAAGSFVIPKTMKKAIEKFLKKNDSKYSTVECIGYTDGPFIRRLDVPLSINRARAVCNFANNLGYKIESKTYVNEVTPGAKLRRVKLVLGN
jgi:surface protein